MARFNTSIKLSLEDNLNAILTGRHEHLSDYTKLTSQVYSTALSRNISVQDIQYHVVCPLHTFHMPDNRCYRDKIAHHPRLIVTPFVEDQTITWQLTVYNYR